MGCIQERTIHQLFLCSQDTVHCPTSTLEHLVEASLQLHSIVKMADKGDLQPTPSASNTASSDLRPAVQETKLATNPAGTEDSTKPKPAETENASSAVDKAADSASSAAGGVKDSVFSMFGGGAKKEKKVEEDDTNEPSGSSKAKKDEEDDDVRNGSPVA